LLRLVVFTTLQVRELGKPGQLHSTLFFRGRIGLLDSAGGGQQCGTLGDGPWLPDWPPPEQAGGGLPQGRGHRLLQSRGRTGSAPFAHQVVANPHHGPLNHPARTKLGLAGQGANMRACEGSSRAGQASVPRDSLSGISNPSPEKWLKTGRGTGRCSCSDLCHRVPASQYLATGAGCWEQGLVYRWVGLDAMFAGYLTFGAGLEYFFWLNVTFDYFGLRSLSPLGAL